MRDLPQIQNAAHTIRENCKPSRRGKQLKKVFRRLLSQTNESLFRQSEIILDKRHPKILLSTNSMTTFAERSFRDHCARREADVSLREICRTLNSFMTFLSIESRPLDRNFVKSFIDCSFPVLKRLSLNGNQFYRDKNSFRRLLLSLPESLEELSLNWNGIDEQSATVLAKRLPNLKNLVSLSLCGNVLGVRGLTVLLQEGNLYQISHLDLSDCDIGDEGAFKLSQFLSKSFSKVKNLVLKMNGIGRDGMNCLVDGLTTNQSLTTLHMQCNEIDDIGVHALMKSLSLGISNVEDLSLSANLISEIGAKEIASMLHKTKLKRLHLDHNFIGDEGAQHLAQALNGNIQNQRLEELSLASNDLSNKSVNAIADALATNCTLNSLIVENNPRLDRRGASAFVQCLQTNRSLYKLKILEENYENHLLNGKIQLYLELNQLRHRYMGNVSISDAAWPHILAEMKQIDLMYFLLRGRPDLFEGCL